MARSHPSRHRHPAPASGVWRERAVGAILTLCTILLGLGLFSHLVPDDNQFLGTLCRIADSMRPWLLAMAILLSLGLLVLKARRSAAIVCAIALTGLGTIAYDYHSRSVPWADEADLRVLWFNSLSTNRIAPDRLELALRNTDADVVVFVEALPAFGMKERLADLYPHALGCRTRAGCSMLVLSRFELEHAEAKRTSRSSEQLVRFTVTPEGQSPVNILATHLIKPWYLSIAAEETAVASRMLKREPSGPLLVMGDFNAAPWSRRVRRLEIGHSLRHPPRPIGTWPATLGALGIPIDHMLVRGGAQFAWQEPWGDDLGSNHRGLLAGIALPDPPRD